MTSELIHVELKKQCRKRYIDWRLCGQLVDTIITEKAFIEVGHPSFADYAQAELARSERALRLDRGAFCLLSSGMMIDSDIERVGRHKAGILWRAGPPQVFTRRNKKHWLRIAENCDCDELWRLVKQYRVIVKSSARGRGAADAWLSARSDSVCSDR